MTDYDTEVRYNPNGVNLNHSQLTIKLSGGLDSCQVVSVLSWLDTKVIMYISLVHGLVALLHSVYI